MKISILLPVYNIEKYLTQCLNSLAVQTFRDFELVIVDDASTDRTPEIIREYAPKFPAIKIIRNATNQHLARTLNIGLKECQGEYIFRIDGDDYAAPDILEKEINALAQNPAANAVVCDRLRVDEQGKPRRLWLTHTEDYYLKKEGLFRVAYGGQPCLIRKDIFFSAGLHNETLRASSDRDIGIKMTQYINIAGIPERLYLYRENPDNITSNSYGYKHSPEYLNHFRDLTATAFVPEDYINDWDMVKRFKSLDFDYARVRQQKYANTILRCALQLAAYGRKKAALEEIQKAKFLAPWVNYSVFGTAIALGFKDLQKLRVNMNCWFRYAYDDLNMVEAK